MHCFYHELHIYSVQHVEKNVIKKMPLIHYYTKPFLKETSIIFVDIKDYLFHAKVIYGKIYGRLHNIKKENIRKS